MAYLLRCGLADAERPHGCGYVPRDATDLATHQLVAHGMDAKPAAKKVAIRCGWHNAESEACAFAASDSAELLAHRKMTSHLKVQWYPNLSGADLAPLREALQGAMGPNEVEASFLLRLAAEYVGMGGHLAEVLAKRAERAAPRGGNGAVTALRAELSARDKMLADLQQQLDALRAQLRAQ